MVVENCPGQLFPTTESKKWKNEMMVLEDVGLEPEIRQHQEFVEKSCRGQLSNHFQPTTVRKKSNWTTFPNATSGDSLANHQFMENIGQANVFHELPRNHWQSRQWHRSKNGKSGVHGKSNGNLRSLRRGFYGYVLRS